MDPVNPMNIRNLHQELRWLVTDACLYPKDSLERRKRLNHLIARIQTSNRLWKEPRISTDDYNDALQQTWFYLCRRIETYNPDQAEVLTWINQYLQYRIQDITHQNAREARFQIVLPNSEPELADKWIEHLPARPEPPPILEEVSAWLEEEKDDLQRVCLRDRPDINGYILISCRVLFQKTWKQLSEEFAVQISTLSSFYHRKCLPFLIQFGELHGYLKPNDTDIRS